MKINTSRTISTKLNFLEKPKKQEKRRTSRERGRIGTQTPKVTIPLKLTHRSESRERSNDYCKVDNTRSIKIETGEAISFK